MLKIGKIRTIVRSGGAWHMRASFRLACLVSMCSAAVTYASAPDTITLTGCVMRAPDALLALRVLPSDAAAPRSGQAGSNTSKASTPLGRAAVAVDRASAGSMTAKGSTPIRGGGGLTDSGGSGGANTSKASTPVRHAGTSDYELHGDVAVLSENVGYIVAVTGSPSGSFGAATLTVESARLIAAGCPF
jgi:hypothetical protein